MSESIIIQSDFKECPYCSEEIKINAKKCKHCNEYLDENLREQNQASVTRVVVATARKSGGVAAVLSFIIPGLGHIYVSSIFSGFFLFFITLGLYAFFFPIGMALHIIVLLDSIRATGAYNSRFE